MEIALLGGTGDIGRGLALRWARDTDRGVVIGSRDADRAADAADEYATALADRGVDADVTGTANAEAAARADVVVCAVPAYYVTDTIEAVADGLSAGDVLVSPAVGMDRDDEGMHYDPPSAGSVAQLAARVTPDGVPVVGAYHNLPAARLSDLDTPIDMDTPVVGDDPEAVETVVSLTDEIDGLRARRAGGLANAREVEAMAPLLINVAANCEALDHVGVKFD